MFAVLIMNAMTPLINSWTIRHPWDKRRPDIMSLKKSNLAQAWLVLLLATLFGTALAGIQAKLGPVIEANKVKETMAKYPSWCWAKIWLRNLPPTTRH